MIRVYLPDSTGLSGNGPGPASPFSCAVTETPNGEWELTPEHPLGEQGKGPRLTEGRILYTRWRSLPAFSLFFGVFQADT